MLLVLKLWTPDYISLADTNLQHSQRDYQTRKFAVQGLRTKLQETEAQKLKQTSELDQLTAQLNVRTMLTSIKPYNGDQRLEPVLALH